MNEKNNDLKQEMSFVRSEEERELSQDDLDQVSGGIITQEGADWLAKKIRQGKAAGSTKENVTLLARFSCGKGALAHATPKEVSQWILDHWDEIH